MTRENVHLVSGRPTYLFYLGAHLNSRFYVGDNIIGDIDLYMPSAHVYFSYVKRVQYGWEEGEAGLMGPFRANHRKAEVTVYALQGIFQAEHVTSGNEKVRGEKEQCIPSWFF